MINYAILKNTSKFEVLKIPKGINLQQYDFTYRKPQKNSSGTSINKYQDFWFKLPKGKGLFKTFDSSYNKEIKDLRIANELICAELCSQIDIPHANYELAHKSEDYGLITYNILKDSEKLVCLAEFLNFDKSLSNNLIDISCALDYYDECGYVVNKSQILFNLYKILVFDALTLQTDRNNFNINFIFNNNTLEISVAPLFDNEYAFNGENLTKTYLQENPTLNDAIKIYSYNAKCLNVEHENYCNYKTYHNNLRNICELAKYDTTMLKFLKNAILKFNVSKAIEEIEKQGLFISDEYKQYLNILTNETKILFFEELKKPKTEQGLYLFNEIIK